MRLTVQLRTHKATCCSLNHLEYWWAATIYATRYPTRYPDFFPLPYPNPTRSQKTLPVTACLLVRACFASLVHYYKRKITNMASSSGLISHLGQSGTFVEKASKEKGKRGASTSRGSGKCWFVPSYFYQCSYWRQFSWKCLYQNILKDYWCPAPRDCLGNFPKLGFLPPLLFGTPCFENKIYFI